MAELEVIMNTSWEARDDQVVIMTAFLVQWLRKEHLCGFTIMGRSR